MWARGSHRSAVIDRARRSSSSHVGGGVYVSEWKCGSRLGDVAWAKDGVQRWSGKRSVKAIECALSPSAAISTGPKTVELQLKKASDVGKYERVHCDTAQAYGSRVTKCTPKPARTEIRNFAPRQGAWGAGRLRPPERAPDKLGQSPLFLRWKCSRFQK